MGRQVSIGDELRNEEAEIRARRELEAFDAANPRRTEHNGHTGTLETGRIGEDFHPTDYDDILRRHNLDPAKWRITSHLGFTAWDVPFRNRDTDELEFHTAQSHRFRFDQRMWGVDLPALYAQVAATKRRRPKPPTGAATVVVCWADIQTGKVDHLGGLKELLERLDDKRAALADYLDRQAFDHIVIADAGDILEGFENFPAQTRTNALSQPDQVDVAATEFWKTITLCERYAPVDVLSIPSNHCQVRRGKDLVGKPGDDWGLHINERLQWHNDPANGGPGLRINFHRPATEWDETLQFDVRGTRLGLAHGHQVNNPDQIKNWWAKMTHGGVLDCHVLVTGHFHFASLRPVGRDSVTGKSRWHIQCPTLDNGSAWVRNKMGEDGDPALAVFQINDEGFDLASFALL